MLKKQAALARSFGVEVQLITPKEAGDLYPVMRTDDLHGADLDPRRRQGQPGRPDACRWPRARATRGATLLEGVEVTGVIVERGRVAGVRTDAGRACAARR